MHRIHSPATPRVPRSKLGATLLQLHRCLEGSHYREQAAVKTFEAWQARWSEHREIIARRLAFLDDEICRLTEEQDLAPHLLIVAADHQDPEDEESAISVKIDFPNREKSISREKSK